MWWRRNPRCCKDAPFQVAHRGIRDPALGRAGIQSVLRADVGGRDEGRQPGPAGRDRIVLAVVPGLFADARRAGCFLLLP